MGHDAIIEGLNYYLMNRYIIKKGFRVIFHVAII